MGNYEQLKQAVSNVIKTNGTQAITGQVLQNTLLNMISTLGGGANFAGLATTNTNPGVPDGPVFYFATSPGTYVNFNGITIDKTDGIYILRYDNGGWKKEIIAYNSVGIEFNALDSLTNQFKDGGVYVVKAGGNIACAIALQTTEWHPYRLRQLIITSAELEGLSETPQYPTMSGGDKEVYKIYYRHYDLSTNKWSAWTQFYKEYKTVYLHDAQKLTASSTADEIKSAFGNRTLEELLALVNTTTFYNSDTDHGVSIPVSISTYEADSKCIITLHYEYTTKCIHLSLTDGSISLVKEYSMVMRGTAEGSEVFNSGGDGNSASGYCSHAEGNLTKASGHYAHAEGVSTSAAGESSHAEGKGTATNSLGSHAEGIETKVQGNADGAHVEGYKTIATANYAHAEGNSTKAGQNAHAEGYGTVAESNSHAEGYETTATAYSHAEGHSTTASGTRSHAEGTGTTAAGYGSHAEGGSTTAEGKYAHAEGASNKSKGNYSHAEGYNNQANGECAHAEGNQTRANGAYSHADGLGTNATNQTEHACGMFNVSTKSDDDAEATLWSVGNGTSVTDRRNAAELKRNGDFYLANHLILKGGIKSKYYLETQNNIGIEEIPIPLDDNSVSMGALFSWFGLSENEDKDWATFVQICQLSKFVFSKGSDNQYFADITFWDLQESMPNEIHFDAKIVHPSDDMVTFVSLIIKRSTTNVTIDRKMSYIETTSIMPLE